jgi:hypothetical protein
MSARDGELYVGHEPRAPREVARFLRRLVVGGVAAVLALAAVVAARHTRLAPSLYEYGVVRELEGTVRERPHPMLLVTEGGDEESHYLLVGQGKRGAHRLVAGMDGRRVRLAGSLIARDGVTMIEVVNGSVVADVSGDEASPANCVPVGPVTLDGEIVDAKCYLGVMNPGAGKTHRDCAVRCISGGSPPLFVARDGREYLLAGPTGESINRDVLDLVGEPVTASGVSARLGDLLVLRADPGAIVPRDPARQRSEENRHAE